jgi:alpha/beta hydrolase family protein
MEIIFKLILFLSVLNPILLFSAERTLPKEPKVKYITVKFNGDSIRGEYLFLDARTEDEKKIDMKNGKLKGRVFVQFHGHAQRADAGYRFTKTIALKSKSGILVLPICDTPYGRDSKWRADKGKDIILMEIVRYALNKNNLFVNGFKKISDKPVFIEPFEYINTRNNMIGVDFIAIGHSHGGILARRFTSLYPDSVTGLVSMSPAGFVHWGDNRFTATSCMTGSFFIESIKISAGIFKGQYKYINESSWSLTRGIAGDLFRSTTSCWNGNFHLGKIIRPVTDMGDSALFVNSSNFPLPNVKNIVLILGVSDSLFNPQEVIKSKSEKNVTDAELKAFWAYFYPKAMMNGAKFTYKTVPGNHNALFVHSIKFAIETLKGTEELLEEE